MGLFPSQGKSFLFSCAGKTFLFWGSVYHNFFLTFWSLLLLARERQWTSSHLHLSLLRWHILTGKLGCNSMAIFSILSFLETFKCTNVLGSYFPLVKASLACLTESCGEIQQSSANSILNCWCSDPKQLWRSRLWTHKKAKFFSRTWPCPFVVQLHLRVQTRLILHLEQGPLQNICWLAFPKGVASDPSSSKFCNSKSLFCFGPCGFYGMGSHVLTLNSH